VSDAVIWGWIVQWYGITPVEDIVIGVLVEPGLMDPVLKLPLSAVAVCVTLSSFFHATVWPALTVVAAGENAMLAIEIVTSAAGVGEVGVAVLPPPQATASTSSDSATPAKVSRMDVGDMVDTSQSGLTGTRSGEGKPRAGTIAWQVEARRRMALARPSRRVNPYDRGNP
jgi:hypothetical protein